jgi:hypothetical protein
MQTVEQKLHSYLFERGMFPDQADQVIAKFKDAVKALTPNDVIKYDSPADDYPPQLYAVWSLELGDVAVEWIDENCPKAWYRPLFAGQKEQSSGSE